MPDLMIETNRPDNAGKAVVEELDNLVGPINCSLWPIGSRSAGRTRPRRREDVGAGRGMYVVTHVSAYLHFTRSRKIGQIVLISAG